MEIVKSRDYYIKLLNRYDLPQGIIIHSEKVADVAEFIAHKLNSKDYQVDIEKVIAGALLHDIGKSKIYKWQNATNHGEASAEIVVKEGMAKLAPIVGRHILDAIISKDQYPLTLEDKIVFYADKIVTHKLVSIKERFDDLLKRRRDIKGLLDAAYKPTKALESELMTLADLKWEDLKHRFA